MDGISPLYTHSLDINLMELSINDQISRSNTLKIKAHKSSKSYNNSRSQEEPINKNDLEETENLYSKDSERKLSISPNKKNHKVCVNFYNLSEDTTKQCSSQSKIIKRKDKFGNNINKRNIKKIRVTFLDRVSCEPLVKEINVESYKKYNKINGFNKEEKIDKVMKNMNVSCQCCIII